MLHVGWLVREYVRHPNELILLLSGLEPEGQGPYLDKISVVFAEPPGNSGLRIIGDITEMRLSLDELMYRFPPLEPLSFPLLETAQNRRVRGLYLWIPPLPDKSDLIEKLINKNIYINKSIMRYSSIFGFSRIAGSIAVGGEGPQGDEAVVRWVAILPLVAALPWRSLVLSNIGDPEISVVYGLDKRILEKLPDFCYKLKKFYKKISFSKIIERTIECARRMGLKFNPTNFTYISYCDGGRYITTSTLASRTIPCPSRRRGSSGKYQYKGPGMTVFSTSRRIFPKVYPVAEERLSAIENISDVSVPGEVRAYDRVEHRKVYTGASLIVNLPHVQEVDVQFSPKLASDSRETNAFLLHIPAELLDMGLHLLLASDKRCVPLRSPLQSCQADIQWFESTLGTRMSRGLYVYPASVLISKYMVYKSGSVYKLVSGLRGSLEALGRADNVHKDIVNNILKNIYSSWPDRGQVSHRRIPLGLKRFYRKVVAHTISHIIYILLSLSDIPLDYVDLYHGLLPTRSGRRVYVAGLLERSKWGTLQLHRAVREYFIRRNVYGARRKGGDLTYRVLGSVRDFVALHLGLHTGSAPPGDDEARASEILRCDAIRALRTLYESYGEEEREVLERLIAILDEVLMLLVYDSGGEEVMAPDYTLYDMLVHSLLPWISSRIENDTGADSSRVDAVIREALDFAVIAVGPDYGMDGSVYSVILERECSEGYMQHATTSKIAVQFFLAAAGVRVSRDPCGPYRFTGSAPMLELASAAARRLSIVTAFLSPETVAYFERLLRERPGLRIDLTWDGRATSDEDKIKRELKRLERDYPGRFRLTIPSTPTHQKRIQIDGLHVQTSWNFMVPPRGERRQPPRGPVSQDYSAEYRP